MIDDKFIFEAKPHATTKKIKANRVDFALQEHPLVQDSWIQNDLGSVIFEERDALKSQLDQALREKEELRSEMQECRDLDEDYGIDIDKQLISMQIRLEQMATQLEFNKAIDSAGVDPPEQIPVNNQSFTLNYKQQQTKQVQYFDLEDIQNLSKQGVKRCDLSTIIEKYESEHAYIESLNLKRVVNDVFKQLEKSLTTIYQHTGTDSPQKGRQLDFNYDLISTLTQQRDYLDNFNGRFSRFTTQLLSLFDYVKSKERMHLTQIESLAEQNQVLFDENCALQKQLASKDQVNIEKIIEKQSQSPSPQKQSVKVKKIVKEIAMLHRSKLEIARSQIYSGDFKSSLINDQPLPQLESVPLEDSSIYEMLDQNFSLIQQLVDSVKSKIEACNQSEEKQKQRLSTIMTNYNVFKQVFDSLIKKQLPRCRTLLKIDCEFIQNTMASEQEKLDSAIKNYSNSSSNTNSHSSGISSTLIQNRNVVDILLPNVNVLNIVKCHEQMIAKIDSLLLSVT